MRKPQSYRLEVLEELGLLDELKLKEEILEMKMVLRKKASNLCIISP